MLYRGGYCSICSLQYVHVAGLRLMKYSSKSNFLPTQSDVSLEQCTYSREKKESGSIESLVIACVRQTLVQ